MDGGQTELVVDFNIGCKITNAYNKQNIYSVLKFTVQRDFECSFFDKCGWGINFVRFTAKLVERYRQLTLMPVC